VITRIAQQRFSTRNQDAGRRTVACMTARLRLAPAPDLGDGSDPSPIKVILADDHATVRRNLRLLLDREHDVEVIAEAADHEALMRHVAAHRPHVLVLDLRLPNGSSIEAIRGVRAQVPDAEIVVLTMEESPSFAQQALDAGAVAFVCKDRADDELPAAVRRAARGEEYISARVAAGLEALRNAVSGDGLSPRETEILRLIALGYTSAEIAQQLGLSRRTVETHRARIHTKLGVATRAQLVSYALGRHLIGN
jgi:two-component system, NarL family, response regulator NreC